MDAYNVYWNMNDDEEQEAISQLQTLVSKNVEYALVEAFDEKLHCSIEWDGNPASPVSVLVTGPDDPRTFHGRLEILRKSFDLFELLTDAGRRGALASQLESLAAKLRESSK